MKCPKCHSKWNSVKNTRSTDKDTKIWRRRLCNKCNFEWTTYEAIDPSNIFIKDRSGKIHSYDRYRLFSSLYENVLPSYDNVPLDAGKCTFAIIEDLELELLKNSEKYVTTTDVNKLLKVIIEKIDKSIWLRFKSLRSHRQKI